MVCSTIIAPARMALDDRLPAALVLLLLPLSNPWLTHHLAHPPSCPQNNVKLRSRHLNVTEKAFVRFTSPLEAHRAVRERQGGFIGSNQLRLRVLQ